MTQLYIAYSGETQVIDPGDVCTFGRSRHCTIRLDPDDLTVARVAEAFLFEGGHWLLRHHDGQRGSSGPALYLIDVGATATSCRTVESTFSTAT
jgi:hypothetical protein